MEASYTHEIVVSSTPAAAYAALTLGFCKWWTTGCSEISNAGDEIRFRFGPTYWVMRARNLVPDNSVELECIEAHHVHEGLPASIRDEWEGTKLKWNILRHGDKSRIVFVHEGLVPSLNCYDVCEQGWGYFFAESLKQYLAAGEGSPFENEL